MSYMEYLATSHGMTVAQLEEAAAKLANSTCLKNEDGIWAQLLPAGPGRVELVLGHGAHVGTTLTPTQLDELIHLLQKAQGAIS